jgi:hypothetical protein
VDVARQEVGHDAHQGKDDDAERRTHERGRSRFGNAALLARCS